MKVVWMLLVAALVGCAKPADSELSGTVEPAADEVTRVVPTGQGQPRPELIEVLPRETQGPAGATEASALLSLGDWVLRSEELVNHNEQPARLVARVRMNRLRGASTLKSVRWERSHWSLEPQRRETVATGRAQVAFAGLEVRRADGTKGRLPVIEGQQGVVLELAPKEKVTLHWLGQVEPDFVCARPAAFQDLTLKWLKRGENCALTRDPLCDPNTKEVSGVFRETDEVTGAKVEGIFDRELGLALTEEALLNPRLALRISETAEVSPEVLQQVGARGESDFASSEGCAGYR